MVVSIKPCGGALDPCEACFYTLHIILFLHKKLCSFVFVFESHHDSVFSFRIPLLFSLLFTPFTPEGFSSVQFTCH